MDEGGVRNSHMITVGVDASRNRSGGAKAHLLGIIQDGDPLSHGIDEVHVWSYKTLLDAIPDFPWLVKHNPAELEGSLLRQAWWQLRRLPIEAKQTGCDVLLNTDAGSICQFEPSVVMSRDMLSYEPGEARRYGISKARLRLALLRWVQNRSMRRAAGVIFLTEYASNVIQMATGTLRHVRVIPHGVGAEFKEARKLVAWPAEAGEPIRCLYVSNAAMYKHQWVVVEAVAALRQQGHSLLLTLAGGGSGRAQAKLDAAIARCDPDGQFVQLIGAVRRESIPALLARANIFVFASSCENMPNTLVEAMAAGLPIACSNRGPMPEILQNGGAYFDPEDAGSIANALTMLLAHAEVRNAVQQRAAKLAERYSWARCADETWRFLSEVACPLSPRPRSGG